MLAIYPGTFDPITKGHVDIANRAVNLFGHVVIAVAHHSRKDPLFTLEERVNLVERTFESNENISVEPFTGLLVNYAEEKGAKVLIRGLRAVSDFEFELQIALTNRQLNQKVDTVLLMPTQRYTYLSSSIVREVARLGGDLSTFVEEHVEIELKKKF